MSKFNPKAVDTQATVNRQGNPAYKMTDKLQLTTAVLTSFFGEKKFHGSTDSGIVRLATSIAATDPMFVAKLAAFARREFNMRSVSHVLTTVLAHVDKGSGITRKLIPSVTVRGDDVTEILSATIAMYGKPIPNSLKRGLSDAVGRFNEYELAKYKASSKALKMKDLLRIVHPTPKSKEHAELLGRVINDTLETPYTWEVELSSRGNTKEVWEELIDSGKVGYMALLRNLRNIIKADVSHEHLMKVLNRLSDAEQVRKSRQFPFSFLSAYKELEKMAGVTTAVLDALETALEHSIVNMPRLKGRTAIAVDVSGSMTWNTISERSSMTCSEIALLFGVMAAQMCEDSLFMTFDGGLYHPKVSAKGGVLQQARKIPSNGGATHMHLPFQYLTDNNISVDRVIMFSDNELNRGLEYGTAQNSVDRYRSTVNRNAWVHAVDLQGYGTQQFRGDRTNIIAGWSEKVLEFFLLAEQGIETLVKRIEDYNF